MILMEKYVTTNHEMGETWNDIENAEYQLLKSSAAAFCFPNLFFFGLCRTTAKTDE